MTLRDHIATILDREIPSEYRKVKMPAAAGAIQSLMDHPSHTLLLHGTPGTGKTLLAWVIYRRLRTEELLAAYGAHDEPARTEMICTTTHDRLDYVDGQSVAIPGTLHLEGIDQTFPALPENSSVKFITEPSDILRHRYDRAWLDQVTSFPGILLVDDVGCVPASDWVVEVLYAIANHRRAWGLPSVYSTNWTPNELAAKFSPAISSRLCGGEVFEVTGQDRRLA